MNAADVLLDTNVLLRTAQLNHPQCRTALDAIGYCRAGGLRLVLVPQVIYEFWVVSTRPVEQNGLGMSPSEALSKLRELLELFTLLSDERMVFDCWLDLVEAHRAVGKSAHDARLVAAMKVHGVPQIVTFNVRDFSRYPDVVPVTPDELLRLRDEGE